MRDIDKKLDELVKELVALPENPTCDDILVRMEKVHKDHVFHKKHLARMDRLFYESLHPKVKP